MHIIHIASELAPIAKVGGLGDVVLGLGKALHEEGHRVEIILPRYGGLDNSGIENFRICERGLWSQKILNTVWQGEVEGLTVYFIEPHNIPPYFGHEKIYGYEDDVERFMYFSRACLDFIVEADLAPDILHLHDWHTALIAPLLNQVYDLPCSVVMTLHNLQYQGECSLSSLEKAGLHELFHLREGKKGNLLKGGIEYADALTTVSPTYAEEIQTEKGGHGLHQTIRKNAHKLTGILNGIHQRLWSPQTDPYLPFNYDEEHLDVKGAIKDLLRERLALELSDVPLVATVARLVPQKGVDLIRHAIFHTLERGGQFILLGSSHDEKIMEDFQLIQLEFHDNCNLHLELAPHEELTHLIYAAADIFIVPSRFEPCGLTQMMAMKYGALPVVRATGGLKDTVFDLDEVDEGNGFVFEEPTPAGIDSALDRALDLYTSDPAEWKRVMVRGMEQDLGWGKASLAYLDVYNKALGVQERGNKRSLTWWRLA